MVRMVSDPEEILVELRVEPIRAGISYLVLLILLNGEMHGYEIMKKLKNFPGLNIRIGSSTTYPLLKMLQEKGLIMCYYRSRGRRRVKICRITDNGIKAIIRTSVNALKTINSFLDIHEKALKGLDLSKSDRIIYIREDLREVLEEIEKMQRSLTRIIAILNSSFS